AVDAGGASDEQLQAAHGGRCQRRRGRALLHEPIERRAVARQQQLVGGDGLGVVDVDLGDDVLLVLGEVVLEVVPEGLAGGGGQAGGGGPQACHERVDLGGG